VANDLTAEESRLFANAREMRSEVVAHRDKFLKPLWDERDRFYMGDQWYDQTLFEWQNPVVVNFCRKMCRWYLSLLTDQPARITVTGRSPDDYAPGPSGMSRTERVDALMRQRFDLLNMDARFALLYNYALPRGVSWYKVCVDPLKKRKIMVAGKEEIIDGEPDVPVIDPWFVMPDPNAAWSCDPVDVVDNCEYIFYWSMRSARYIKRAFPRFAERITGLQTVTQEDLPPWHFRQPNPYGGRSSKERWMPQANAAGSSTNTGGNWILPGTDIFHKYSRDRFMMWECWMKDPDYEKPVVVTGIGDTMLDVRESGHDHGQFPFGLFVVEPVPGKAMGFGILDSLIGPQRCFNTAAMQAFEAVTKANHRELVSEEDSIDSKKLVVGLPDQHLTYKVGAQPPTYLASPQFPPEVFRTMDTYRDLISNLSDIGEAVTASAMKAGVAGVAIEGMIDQAMQAIRMTERWNLPSKRRLGRLLLSDMQQLYKHTGYEVRVLGEGGDPQSILLAPDDFLGEYDFEIWPNSAMSLKFAEWFKKGMDLNGMLMQAQGQPLGFPLKELIRYANFPDPESLTKQIEQNLNTAGQMQALQQQVAELQKQVPQVQPQPGQPQGGQVR